MSHDKQTTLSNQPTSSRKRSITDTSIRGAHSQTAIVAIRAVLSLAYFSIMSRLLTPDDFGYFALITAVTTILNTLSEAGLGSSVIQRKDATKDFISTAFTLSVLLGLFFSCVLFFGARMFSELVCKSDTLTLAFRIMSSIIFLQAANNITWSLYMRKLDFFKFGILQVASEVLSYITAIIFAVKGFGFYSIVAASVSSQIFLTLILIIGKKYQFRIIIVRKYIRDIIGYGGWLTAGVLVRNVTNEIDKVVIGRFLPIADLGAINRPSGFVSRISSQVNGVFDTVLFPILSSIQHDKSRITRGYLKIVSLIICLSLVLGGSIALGAKIVIDIFFGSQWEHLEPILIIFALSMMLHGFSRVSDSFFRSLGIVKRYFWARQINCVIMLIFVIIGCQFGILAVAIAMASGTLASCIIKYFMQRPRVGVKTSTLLKTVGRHAAWLISLFVACLIIRYTVPYGEFIGVGLFLTLVIASMIFTPRLYGPTFREVVIDRYLKKFRKLRIY